MAAKIQLNTIEEAIEDIRQGKIIIVVDDEDRENEGDFLAAAEKITPEMVNFMATHGKGLNLCTTNRKSLQRIGLTCNGYKQYRPYGNCFYCFGRFKRKWSNNWNFCFRQIKNILALVDSNTKPYDLARPGHIFPLIAKQGGVLRRTGHTEAAIDFARLAGFKPAGVIVEIMNEDGSMARLPQLVEVAKKFDLKLVSIEDLVAYRMQHDSLIIKKEDFEIETRFGNFRLRAY